MPIPLLHLQKTDSTSLKASNLISSGKECPFAVLSDTQIMGKGRHGHHWHSPKGNLYLTIAIKTPKLNIEDRLLLPTFSALILAKWLKKHCKFRATLKWPNDLYFSGKKLAGILCESSVAGDSWGPLLIGIGLNVNLPPQLPKGSYESISISDIIHKAQNPATLARSIIDFYEEEFEQSIQESLNKSLPFFSIFEGQIWINNKKNFLFHHSIAKNGSLKTIGAYDSDGSNKIENHNSGLTWAFQKKESNPPICIADFGNTSAKIAIFSSAFEFGPCKTWTIPIHPTDHSPSPIDLCLKSLAEIETCLKTIYSSPVKCWPIYYGAVNHKLLNDLNKKVATTFKFFSIPKRPLRSWGEHYKNQELGIDRLAFIEFWLSKYNSKKNCEFKSKIAILVNLGTATTVDLVTHFGEHLGGFICAGLKTSIDSLSLKAEKLPQLNLSQIRGRSKQNLELGHDTWSSINNGTIYQTIGFISHVYKLTQEQFNLPSDSIELILSGGNARYIAPHINSQVEPTATLDGLRILCLGG